MADFKFDPSRPHRVYHFDSDIARGQIGIEESIVAGGLRIFVEGHCEPVAIVDLYYCACPDAERGINCPQIRILDPTRPDTTVAYIYFARDGVYIEPAQDVKLVSEGRFKGMFVCHHAPEE